MEPPRTMKSRWQHLMIGLVLALAVPLTLAATDTELRAAVIYNIARFVQWPPAVEPNSNQHFDICTLGNNPLAEALNVLKGKTLNGAPAIVRPTQRDDLSGCHLLYVAEDHAAHMKAISQTLATNRAATLTISDAPSFLALGGMVQLVVLNDRLQFRVNQELAEKAKLSLNAKLLQLALPGVD